MLKPLAGILPGLLDSLGLADQANGWRAVTEWPSVAGARIARHSHAVSFREGILTVEVEGSAWMHELAFLRRELVRKTNRHLGSDIVREVRLVPAQGGHRR